MVSDSITLVMELHLFCMKPSICMFKDACMNYFSQLEIKRFYFLA